MKLLDELRENGVGDDVLDRAVHQVAGIMATNINNQGLDAQVAYLRLAGWGEDDIRRRTEPEDLFMIGYMIGNVLVDPCRESDEVPRRVRLTWADGDQQPSIGRIVPAGVGVEELT